MEKSIEGRGDDLEIASIGAIYSGAWDKKYWSSSRGKDRYPYPVGYQAIRTYSGSIYKMEIKEGLKGPLFVINSSDGRSCSGQTPDMAWDSFQKKGYSRVKMWHRRRSSSKIDGIEFFGFRNPFVQRLLRELVANINGTAQKNLSSSSFCNGALGTEPDGLCPDSSTYIDLPADLVRPQITKKRGRQQKSKSIKPNGEPRVKKLQSSELTYNANAPNCTQGNETTQSNKNSTSSFASNQEHNICNHPQAVSVPVGLEAAVDRKTSLSSYLGGPHFESFQSSDNVKVDTLLPQDDNHHRSPKNCKSTQIQNKSSTLEETLHRSQDTDASRLNSFIPIKDKDGKVPTPNDCAVISHVDLYVADTLDLLQEDSSVFASADPRGSPCNVEDNVVPAEVILTKLDSEDGIRSSISNPSSEMSEFDSTGQDIAQSMMSLLLPQALPLLKGSSKKKANAKPSEISQHMMKFEEVNNGNIHFVDGASTGSHSPDNLELLGCGDAQKKSSVWCLRTSGDKEIFGPDVHVDLDERPSNVEKHISKSALGCSSAGMKVFHRRSNVVGINCNGSSQSLKADCEEKDLTSAPNNRAGAAGTATHFPDVAAPTIKYNGPLSENIIFRNSQDGFVPQKLEVCEFKGKDTLHFFDRSVSHVEKPQDNNSKIIQVRSHLESNSTVQNIQKLETSFCDNNVTEEKEVQAASHRDAGINNELEDIVDLVGCYVHPMAVSSLLLNTKGHEIFICVLCGNPVDKDRTLFLYKIPFRERKAPSFIGHASISLRTLTDKIEQGIAMERSCLQFTPDGQHLVVINKIKAPYCREQKIDCPCPTCKSDSYEENVVRIVQVKPGYFSVLATLKAADSVLCILVCGPDHLVAVEESGRLHIWVMNAVWSAQADEFVLPTHGFIVEVKKIPRCNLLIVGHNGFGEFVLWDISKRSLISRFSASSAAILNFLPVSLFSWEMKGPASEVEEYINRIMDTTKNRFLEQSDNFALLPPVGEDMAVWLLVSTVSNSDVQHYHQASDCQTNLGDWRLALLAKSSVILGSQLDPRASAVGASVDNGIIGTHDGLVYMSELSTGTKLGNLHCFKGHAVSCIAVDDSWPFLMGVAGEGGQLLVYLRSRTDFTNS